MMFFRRTLWLVPAVIATALTAYIMLVMPADRTLHNLGDFGLKISPVAFGVVAIALFPRGKWGAFLVLAGVITFLGAIDSATFIQVSNLVDTLQFSAYYRFSLFVDAFVVLFGLLAYRMGGGSTERVLRLGFAATLILVSGLNDLTMWLMYAWPDGVRPETFSWASHVAIFIGREPSVSDMLVFFAVHLSLAGLVMLLRVPTNRLGQWPRVQQPTGRRSPPATLATEPGPPQR